MQGTQRSAGHRFHPKTFAAAFAGFARPQRSPQLSPKAFDVPAMHSDVPPQSSEFSGRFPASPAGFRDSRQEAGCSRRESTNPAPGIVLPGPSRTEAGRHPQQPFRTDRATQAGSATAGMVPGWGRNPAGQLDGRASRTRPPPLKRAALQKARANNHQEISEKFSCVPLQTQ